MFVVHIANLVLYQCTQDAIAMRKICATNCAIYAPMQPFLTVTMIQHMCSSRCLSALDIVYIS